MRRKRESRDVIRMLVRSLAACDGDGRRQVLRFASDLMLDREALAFRPCGESRA